VNLLADGAPTGAGLAIVGVILLVFVAICALIAFFVIRGLVRLWRRRKSEIADPSDRR
jgi:nucleoside permease NupC